MCRHGGRGSAGLESGPAQVFRRCTYAVMYHSRKGEDVMRVFAAVGLIVLVTGAQPPKPEATSLLGKPLVPAAQAPEQRAKLEAELPVAKTSSAPNPANAARTTRPAW